MVDTARIRFPQDMTEAAGPPDASPLGAFATDALERAKRYARDEPFSFALWTFGIGFVLGWKLKPW